MNSSKETQAPASHQALNSVVFVEGNSIIHQASADFEYATGDFGRDQIAVALDMLVENPEIARLTLISLAEKQGTAYDAPDTYPLTEVAPGRIHHERRSPHEPTYLRRSHFANDKEYDDLVLHCKNKSQKLIDQWGETYYGSIDATPKYLILAREYLLATKNYGILDQIYTGRDGKERTIRESLFMAANWINTTVNYGPNTNLQDELPHEPVKRPLLRFKRLNGRGIENQIMMDSKESF